MWRFGTRPREVTEIDRNAPPKAGAALFVDILRREWWELFKLNLVMALFALPVVTIPAMLAGATRITTAMIADQNHYLWRDFWETFRARFWLATLLGAALGLAAALGAVAVVVYAREAAAATIYVVPMLVSLVGTLLVILVASHAFTLMVLTDLTAGRLLRTAVLMGAAGLLPGLGALAICAAVWLAHVVAYPVSIFIPATFGFSFCALVMTFQSQRALVAYRSSARGGADDRPLF